MIKRKNAIFAVLFLILFTQLNFTFAAEDTPEYYSSNPNIKVGLNYGSGVRASYETNSPHGFIIGEIRTNEPDIFYPASYLATTKIAVTRRNNGLAVINPANNAVLYEYSHTSNNLAIIAAQPQAVQQRLSELSARTTGLTTSSVNNVYSGAFIYKASGGGVEVVNLVSLEDYIKGVVPYEISPNWETEALRAFSIAARTYAVNTIRYNRHADSGFAICNSTHCQLFIGLRNATERTNAAVDDTRDLVLTYEGRIIEAVYHSSSGGVTENHNDAWGGELRYPYLSSVQLPFEDYTNPARRNAFWTHSATPRELYEYLTKESPQSALFTGKLNAPIAEIKINQRSLGSNYIKSVTVRDTNGNTVTVDNSDRIRSAFGKYANSANMDIFKPSKFRAFTKTVVSAESQDISAGQTYIMSANGLTRATPNQLIVASANGLSSVQSYATGTDFIFDGKGWGHGVGMSQWATQDMALLGYGYEQIVKTFYTGTSIQKLPDIIK